MDLQMLAQAAVRNSFMEVTLGNVLTMASMAIGGLIAWGKLSDRVEGIRSRQDEHQRRLDDLANAGMPMVCRLHTERLAKLEEHTQPIQVIANDVAWIKHTIQRNGLKIEET